MNNTIGIEISKDTLDAHRLADGQHKQFLNGKTGHAQLVKWIGKPSDPLIIFKRPDDKSSENNLTNADPTGSTNGLENKPGETEVDRNKNLTEIVDPERMIRFGSSDFEKAVRSY